MKRKPFQYSIACLICILTAAVVPASAAPEDPWVWAYEDEWNQYVGLLLDRIPLALKRAENINHKIEQQGVDVTNVTVHINRAWYYYHQATTEYKAGNVTSQKMEPVNKVKYEVNYILVQLTKIINIDSPEFKGMEHAYYYAFPTFDQFLAML